MGTENEVKFVLRIESEKIFSSLSKNSGNSWREISQAYLDSNLRIRGYQYPFVEWKHEMTYKRSLSDRVLEINVPIDRRDYEDLYKLSTHKLKKIRYEIWDENKQFWEVDFFINNDNVYFAMAELEMPEGQKSPSRIPNFIQDNLLYAVPKGHKDFSSFSLCDIEHATKIYEKLLQQT